MEKIYFVFYKKNKVEIKDIREEYYNLINFAKFTPNIKLILNKRYSNYFSDFLKGLLISYEELEIKVLDDNILYQYQELNRGL